MNVHGDPRQQIQEAVDYLQKWAEDRFTKHADLSKAIDTLGEEVAEDINAFEQMIKQEGGQGQDKDKDEKWIGLSQQVNSIITEVKVLQARVSQ